MKERNLRNIQYWSLLSGSIISQFILVQFLVYGELKILNYEKIISSSGIMLFLTLSVFLIPASIKHKMIFFRLKNELPGCRVFTDLINKDYRITPKDISNIWGEVPTDPKEQNRIWFTHYQKVQYKERVFRSHQYFLLLRDAATSFLMLTIIGYGVIFLYFNLPSIANNIYLPLSAIVFIIFSIAANNLGKRFATNVIVEAISEQK